MISSLRARLLLGTALISATALCVLGAAMDAAVRRMLLNDFDAASRAKGKSLASMVEEHHGHIAFEFDPDAMPEFSADRNPEYFQVWLENKAFVHSGSLGLAQLQLAQAGMPELSTWTALPDGRRGRLISFTFAPYTEPEPHPDGLSHKSTVRASITLARDTRELDQTLNHLRWTALVLSVLAIAFSGLGLIWVVHRATRPVKRLAERIGGLKESDLNERLSTTGVPSELMPVVERLNGLLGRLSAAFTRERAFTADVAHELRTPLAGLRATMEVCRTRPRNSAGYELAIDKSLDQLVRLQSLVENLLLLARAEAGQLTVDRATIDLGLVVDECWSNLDEAAARRNLQLTRGVPEHCRIACDANVLRIVISNLLDNAVSYADANGEIQVMARPVEGKIILEVTNAATKLQPGDIPHVFERFWRGDLSRSHTGRHAGLGLSLCRRLLELTGNTIDVVLPAEGVFQVQVTLTRT